MSDPTQAQAEDRRAHEMKLTRIGNLVAALAHPKDDHRQNDLEDEAHDLLRELRAELSRLSRVEQALRAVGNYMEGENLEFIQVVDPHWAALIRQVRAALSASPSSQPKER